MLYCPVLQTTIKNAKGKRKSPKPPSKASPGLAEEVSDRVGFGRFLQLLCSEHVRGKTSGELSLSDLARRAKNEFSRSYIDRIHHGEAPVHRDQLPKLAKIYEIEPMVLYNFLLPSFPYAIIHSEEDMVEVHEKSLPEGVTYRLPRCRLASSDMTIAILTIKNPTRPNHHPGLELIKTLEGKVSIELGGIQAEIRRGQYAHFYSHMNHRVENVGREPAKILSIRFIR